MSSTMSGIEASRIQAIIMQIDELVHKQYREPLTKIQAQTLHRLQLELIEKDFAAYQSLQQKFSVRLQQVEDVHLEKNFHNHNLKPLGLSPDTTFEPYIKKINPYSFEWQNLSLKHGNENPMAFAQQDLNKTIGPKK